MPIADHPWGFPESKRRPEAIEHPAPASDRPIAEDYLPTALNELDFDSLLVAPAATGVRQENVLLIEDSEEAMLLVRYSLQAFGDGRYRLKWVESLSEGLVQLSKGGVDIVLVDLGLPDSSGLSGLASVREAAPGSASASADRRHAGGNGVRGFRLGHGRLSGEGSSIGSTIGPRYPFLDSCKQAAKAPKRYR